MDKSGYDARNASKEHPMDKALLEQGGINVNEALERMIGNEKLLSRLLGKFLEDASCERLAQAIAVQDAQAAAEAAHTLKGVSGNLSISTVYDLASRQCDLFRSGAWEEGCALMPQVEDACRIAQDAIRTGA